MSAMVAFGHPDGDSALAFWGWCFPLDEMIKNACWNITIVLMIMISILGEI